MSDIITRLKIESGEYDSKIKRAVSGFQQMEQECRRVNGTLAVLEKDQKQYVQSLGQMQTVSNTVRGKIGELSSAFVELRAQYNRLTEEEKRGDYGKALSKSLDQLKSRISDSKKELSDIQQELNGGTSKFGDFGKVIDTVGNRLGVSGSLTEMLTSKTAMLTAGVGAGIAIVGEATKAWMSYNAELSKQDQITKVTTGLTGPDSNRMTDAARAMADVYKVDFREAINAANTLMTQFGKTGDEAIQLLRDGMQGMIQGDGPKLLSMIQQYAPAFRDAGVSASQLVAVIQNSEGGIFTDQNMNAIVMGIKNIRLMTKQTSDALEKLGIDGQEMSRKLNDGSITVFDALKQVASQLKTVDSNSQAAGEVMQAVFGRQGVSAGTNLGKAIETLNTNLQETKKQTGEVGEAYDDLLRSTEKLNTAIREAFGYNGWEEMANGIKSKLITALADVLTLLNKIRDYDMPDWLKGPGDKPKPYSGTKVDTDYITRGSSKADREKRYNTVTGNINKKLQNLNAQEAALGKPYTYTDKNGGLVEQIDTPEEIAQKRRQIQSSRQILTRRLNTIQSQHDTLTAEPVKANTTPPKTGGNGGGSGSTSGKAGNTPADDIAKAEANYAATMNMAQRDLMENVITQKKYDETIFKGQQDLANAYNKAYEATGDEKYLKAYQETASHVTEMQGVIDSNIEAQKESEKTARELANAQKKLTDAQNELADAQASGDLKRIYAAEKKVETAQVQVDARTSTSTGEQKAAEVPITISNLDAIKQKMTEEIATTPVGDPLLKNMQEAFSDASAIGTIFSTAVKNGIDTATFDTSGIMQKLLNRDDISDETIQGYVDQLNALLKEKFDETEWPKVAIAFDVKTKEITTVAHQQQQEAQKMAKDWQAAGSAIQQVGAAMNAIQDPAAKVMGTIAQAIGSVALGAGQAIQNASSMGPWAWIAFAAAATATMITTINSIHSATGYAEGGIIDGSKGGFVQGNTYSGDQVGNVRLNAGELVLNRAQQGVLADALDNEGGGAISSTPYVTGEQIYLGLNNYLKGAGLGQIVTSNG